MLAFILMSIVETLLFLKVIEQFTPVVTMMISVIGNLWDFMVFYCICLLFLGIIFPVLSVDEPKDSAEFRTEALKSVIEGGGREYPGYEYYYLNGILKYFIMTLRISTGDYDFSYMGGLSNKPGLPLLYWILWIIIVVITSVIMLNFVIAKACDCY